MASLSRDQPLMPGAFGPEDYIDFYENPFEVLDGLESSWERREPRVSWAVKNLPNLDIVDLDWHKYDPPKALRKAPNITSQVLLDILQSSLENVKARIIEEDRQKKEIEEQRKQEQTEKGKSKEPYLPIIIPTEPLVAEKTSQIETPPEIRKKILMTTFGPSVVNKVDAKANKRHLFALRRFFQRSDHRGESSAAGAALGALRKETAEAEHAREGLSRLTQSNTVEEV
ncbi:hypothetical protein IL306_004198 [Fusarium sp. DS 682]|nr:hypothetical protein IL306_004198 [Fusarium sp. DS 682]